jgi:hypothetical protein
VFDVHVIDPPKQRRKKKEEELTVLIVHLPIPINMGFANAYSLSLNKFE